MDVLLIEDDAAVRASYTKALQQHGFTVTAVPSAIEALALVEQHPFNAVICDVALPGLDGTTFFERLVEKLPHLSDRVVFVTGWGKDEKTRRLLEHSGRPYLTKPVELSQLVSAVTQVVIRSKSEIESPREHKA